MFNITPHFIVPNTTTPARDREHLSLVPLATSLSIMVLAQTLAELGAHVDSLAVADKDIKTLYKKFVETAQQVGR